MKAKPMNFVVCLKQVPAVSELEWDPKTGGLKRERAGGMMDLASRHALEAALTLKAGHGGRITAIAMGPVQAEESLREALSLGADVGVLISDPALVGADTLVTSQVLARAVKLIRPDFDLVLTGCFSADSETAQVGPQLAEELQVAGVAYVEEIDLRKEKVRVVRLVDSFLETLEFAPPGVVTVTTGTFLPRYVDLAGVEVAFERKEIYRLDALRLGLDPAKLGQAGSPTKMKKVYSATAQKDGLILKGSVQKSVRELFDRFGGRLNGFLDQGYSADE